MVNRNWQHITPCDRLRCGEWALKELRTLVHMARVPPTEGQWSAFYARLCCLIALLIWLDEPFALGLDEPFALEFCGGKEVRAQK